MCVYDAIKSRGYMAEQVVSMRLKLFKFEGLLSFSSCFTVVSPG